MAISLASGQEGNVPRRRGVRSRRMGAPIPGRRLPGLKPLHEDIFMRRHRNCRRGRFRCNAVS